MKKRELGKTEIFVSELGFGAMSLPNDIQEAAAIFDTALHAGINFFDTADLYAAGKNEEMIAPLLKGRRNDIVLATKVGNERSPDGKTWAWNPSKKHITAAIKKSLQRLGTDYIDLYQLHGGTMEDDVLETIDAFENLKKEGLILQYGISSIRPTVIDRFLEHGNAASVMMQYSALDRRPEEWFAMIEKKQASVITRGTIAKGFLTNKGTHPDKSSKGFAAYTQQDLLKTTESLTTECEDLHSAAIHFVLHEKAIASALVGANSKEQLLDSIHAYEKDANLETIKALQKLTKKHQYREHRLL